MKRGQPNRTEPRNSLVGNKYFKLTVISLHKYIQKTTTKPRKIEWLCKCDCGNENIIAEHNNLISSNRKSCGCMRKETLKKMWNGNSKENSFISAILREYKKNAFKRNFEFNLDYDSFTILITGNCNYCSCPPSKEKRLHIKRKYSHNTYLFNGIDRVNSNLGYTKENSVSCYRKCNLAKSDMTLDEFKNWLRLIYKNFINESEIKINNS